MFGCATHSRDYGDCAGSVSALLHVFIGNMLSIQIIGYFFHVFSGKSVYIQKHLYSLPMEKYVPPIVVGFSARTSANTTQYLIDAKLDRRRKGVFGPPVGKTAIIFVDDLNMPQVEQYGAQPPIELLRQFMDHDGWYDR